MRGQPLCPATRALGSPRGSVCHADGGGAEGGVCGQRSRCFLPGRLLGSALSSPLQQEGIESSVKRAAACQSKPCSGRTAMGRSLRQLL